jgi:transcriptional regulator with XRE-family HTH domain
MPLTQTTFLIPVEASVHSPLSEVPPVVSEETEGTLPEKKLHRIAQVRRQQGLTLRTVARRMGTTVGALKVEEQSDDLRLSDLQRWHEALEVPLSELVEEPGLELSSCVKQRAQLLRIMKTAAAIKEQSQSKSIGILAQSLIAELIEIMPELKDVAAWHSVGQRRTLEEFGKVMTQAFSAGALAQ